MKKICITLSAILIICVAATVAAKAEKTDKSQYLRIHIRANSNDENDQNIKMEVKNIVVEYLTPIVLKSETKAELVDGLKREIPSLNALIDGFLSQNGFGYKASTRINEEYFPLRVYEETTLEAGYYDALIIDLGSGKGDNWWCVVYPPLCFTDRENVRYRSLIYEYVKERLSR